MRAQIRSFFSVSPQENADERAQAAQLLKGVLDVVQPVQWISLAIMLAAGIEVRRLIPLMGAIGVVLAVRLAAQRGYPGLISPLAMISFWALLGLAAWVDSGLFSPAFTSNTGLIVVASLLAGWRIAALLAVLSTAEGIGLAWAMQRGWVAVLPQDELILSTLLGLVANFAALAFLLRMSQHNVHRALAAARREVAERRRAESQMRLQSAALASTANGVVITDRQGIVLWSNPAFTALTGFSAEEVRGHNLGLQKSGEQSPDFYQQMWRTIRDGQVWRGELINLRKNGSAYFEEMTITPVRADPAGPPQGQAGGEITHFVAVKQDVTRRRQASLALQRHAQAEEIIASISTTFINLAPEALDAEIERALGRVGEHFGADRSYLFRFSPDGQSMSNTHEWCAPGIEPAIDRLQAVPATSYALQRLQAGHVFNAARVADLPPEADAEKADLEAQGVQSVVCVPIKYRGCLTGFVGLDAVRQEQAWPEEVVMLLRTVGEAIVSALERRQAEQTLRESEARLQLALDAAQLGAWEYDALADVSYYSEQYRRIYGGSETGLGFDSIHPDDLPAVEQLAQKVRDGELDVFSASNRILLPDGSVRWVQSWGRASRDAQGRLGRIAGVLLDITERKQAEEDVLNALQREQRLNEIARALGSSLDLSTILPSIVRLAAELVGADASAIGLVSPDGQQLSNSYTFGLAPDPDLDRPIPRGQGVSWQVIDSLQTHWIKDYAAYPAAVAEWVKAGIRGMLETPLIAGEDCLGVLGLYLLDPARRFSERDVALAEALGRQAAIAIQNARLYEAIRRQLAELSVLHTVAVAAVESKQAGELLERAVQVIGQNIYSDLLSVWLRDETGQALVCHARYYQGQVRPPLPEALPVKVGIIGTVVARGQALRVPDVLREPLYRQGYEETRSEMCVPLRIGGRVMGALNAESRKLDAFSQDDERLLVTLAGQLALAIERLQAEAAMSDLNAELERRVKERTAQLEAANREMEAFSYSISHDLRAPLRSIDGFSRILQEEYAPRLDAEVQRYLDRLRSGAQRMNQLIDGLLAFSRLSRQPLNQERVDTAQLVQAVLEELQPDYEGRPVEIALGDLPACQADPVLLRQVFTNLCSNALKYSRLRHPARIEIGCQDQGGQPVYFVRDNGAGFNMRYADKLFGVFQRLHAAEEYEGVGVGLAIVQRIILRHGGRIWAEAEADRGATFYFTLG